MHFIIDRLKSGFEPPNKPDYYQTIQHNTNINTSNNTRNQNTVEFP